jgi:ABC-type multidrug transport system fused ATPase/permease subunit
LFGASRQPVAVENSLPIHTNFSNFTPSMKGHAAPSPAKSIFSVAFKSIAFAWETNKALFVTLILLNIFLGSVVYLQFTSFSSIVDEIILIQRGLANYDGLIRSAVILGLAFLLPTIISNVVSFFRNQFRLAQGIQLEMYKIEKQSALDIGTIESNSYQTLLRGAKEWGSGSVLNLQDFIFTSASSFAGILTSMTILWSLNPWLVLFALLAAAPVYFFYKKYSMEVFRIRYLSIDDHRIIGNRISHFEELQKAVDVILLKLKEWLKDEIRERKTAYNRKIIEAEKKKTMSYALLSLWYLLFLFAAIALMTWNALEGGIAVGALLLAFNTYTRFYQTVNGYVESISFSEEAARYAAKWFELFELQPKIASRPAAVRMDFSQPPLIEFRDVSFCYPQEDKESPYVLKNLSFTMRPGQKIAIVGVNGAGKTTLIKLLCRVYDPSSGAIFVNGIDLRDIHLGDWQSAIGILFQDFPVYNLTIRESIGVGRITDKADDEKLKLATQYSGADEFITNYDQLIWKEFRDGVDLSKGQHQRLAVARMFYRNAAITILDEPTASIDAVTEEKIFTALEENMEGKTVILITHRFSTVKNADNIILLEHGTILEQGSHRDLMSLNGKYADLYNMQARRYLDEVPSHTNL